MSLQALLLLFAATAGPAALISWVANFAVRRAARRLGLMDRPGERKVHTAVTPLGGGLGIWLGIVGTFALGTLAVLISAANDQLARMLPAQITVHFEGLQSRLDQLWILLAAATVLMLLGLADDRRGLPWWFRMIVEFAVAAVVVFVLGYQLTAFIPIPWLTGVLSVLWIVTTINSFNMLDNMDGLSGGVAAIIAAMLAGTMLLTPDIGTTRPQIFVAALLLVVCGAVLGFLWHNRPPARLFMGDAGAYLVGFLIGVSTLMATYAGYRGAKAHSVLVPLCVMAVPLYDLASVIWIRIREGRSPFQADKRHFSHRLVDLGFRKGPAVLTIYLVTATCGLAGMVLGRTDLGGALLVLAIVGCMLGIVRIMESPSWRIDDE